MQPAMPPNLNDIYWDGLNLERHVTNCIRHEAVCILQTAFMFTK